jgi:hypothetical protein
MILADLCVLHLLKEIDVTLFVTYLFCCRVRLGWRIFLQGTRLQDVMLVRFV